MLRAGRIMPISRAIIAMTTRSSMSVKAFLHMITPHDNKLSFFITIFRIGLKLFYPVL